MVAKPANSMNQSSASGIVTWDGTATESTQALAQYNVVSGASANTVNNITPTATSGNPLVSQGASAQPVFSSTASVTQITISNAPSSGTDGTNKTYVDTAIASVNPSTSVYAATTTNIPGAYLNGAGGI